MDSKKFLLQERDIPTAWYNIIPDMPNKPRPYLNPATKQPLKAEDFFRNGKKENPADGFMD